MADKKKDVYQDPDVFETEQDVEEFDKLYEQEKAKLKDKKEKQKPSS